MPESLSLNPDLMPWFGEAAEYLNRKADEGYQLIVVSDIPNVSPPAVPVSFGTADKEKTLVPWGGNVDSFIAELEKVYISKGLFTTGPDRTKWFCDHSTAESEEDWMKEQRAARTKALEDAVANALVSVTLSNGKRLSFDFREATKRPCVARPSTPV